jgi:hypothetical protein
MPGRVVPLSKWRPRVRVYKVPNKGHYARVGDFHGPVEPTPQKAVESLYAELEAYHPLDHTYVRSGDGSVLHVHQTPSHGWNIYIIHPEGYNGDGIGVQGTRAEAVARAQEWAEEHGGLV